MRYNQKTERKSNKKAQLWIFTRHFSILWQLEPYISLNEMPFVVFSRE